MSATLTPKGVAYLGMEEGLTLEAYRDTGNVWTWALGVTDASGHKVSRYIDNPQSLEKALEISVWLIREKYLPAVEKAFKGDLDEAQTAAALSFHWNTGAISRAQWVKDFNSGNRTAAYNGFLQWTSRGLLEARRKRERELFFNGIWPTDLRANVYPVGKPGYRPMISKAKRVDLLPDLQKIL